MSGMEISQFLTNTCFRPISTLKRCFRLRTCPLYVMKCDLFINIYTLLESSQNIEAISVCVAFRQ